MKTFPQSILVPAFFILFCFAQNSSAALDEKDSSTSFLTTDIEMYESDKISDADIVASFRKIKRIKKFSRNANYLCCELQNMSERQKFAIFKVIIKRVAYLGLLKKTKFFFNKDGDLLVDITKHTQKDQLMTVLKKVGPFPAETLYSSKFRQKPKTYMLDIYFGVNRYRVMKEKMDFSEAPEVKKHFKKGLIIPQGSSNFYGWFHGKDDNYVNWKKRFYLGRIDDLDVRTVIINNDYYELYDSEPNPGLRDKSFFSVTWLERTLIVECKKKTYFTQVGAWALHENRDFLIFIRSRNAQAVRRFNFRKFIKYKGAEIHYTVWSKKNKSLLYYSNY